ncbi:MAG: IS66 family transposase, partial [Myxococcaceae bacterium]
MPRELPANHFCPWREEAEELRERMTSLESKMAALERRVFGKKTEKLPPVAQELRGEARSPEEETARAEAALVTRRERAARKAAEAPTREVRHAVPAESRYCPACGSEDLKPLGEGRRTVLYEYVPAHFERQVHVQEVLACACGQGVVTAPAPARVVDRG